MAHAKRSDLAKSFDWNKLSELLGPSSSDPPPAGSITVQDFSIKRGLALSSSGQSLRKLVHDGAMECGLFYNKERGRKVKYFWLKEK